MPTKSPSPDEFRMGAAEFDKMMRGALSAPTRKKAKPAPKVPKKAKPVKGK